MQPPEDPPTNPDGFPPVPPRKQHHWYRPRNIAIGTGALLVGIIVAGVATGSGDSTSSPPPHNFNTPASVATSASPTPSADINGVTCVPSTMVDGYCPTDTPATDTPTPEVTVTSSDEQIVFKVWGSGQPSIQYGTDSDNRDGGGHVGILGEGNYLPWSAHLKFHDSALYYYVTAQLEGSGDIKCALVAKVTDHYSDGTQQSKTEKVASGHASGGYNICTAESS